jgi:hypothetical protein
LKVITTPLSMMPNVSRKTMLLSGSVEAMCRSETLAHWPKAVRRPMERWHYGCLVAAVGMDALGHQGEQAEFVEVFLLWSDQPDRKL